MSKNTSKTKLNKRKRKERRRDHRRQERANIREAERLERLSWGVKADLKIWTECEITEADREEGLPCNKGFCPLSLAFKRAGFVNVKVTAYTVVLDGITLFLPPALESILDDLDRGREVKLPFRFRIPFKPHLTSTPSDFTFDVTKWGTFNWGTFDVTWEEKKFSITEESIGTVSSNTPDDAVDAMGVYAELLSRKMTEHIDKLILNVVNQELQEKQSSR